MEGLEGLEKDAVLLWQSGPEFIPDARPGLACAAHFLMRVQARTLIGRGQAIRIECFRAAKACPLAAERGLLEKAQQSLLMIPIR